MECMIDNRLYIKSNGDIPCFCGIGENKVLHKADESTDFIGSVLNGKPYARIRESLRKNMFPWQDICPDCIFMDVEKKYSDRFQKEKTISWLQIEPSFLCNLACTTCMPLNARPKMQTGAKNLSLGIFEKLIDDISGAGISVELINFQGRGEPLMNKDIWKMVSYARARFPDSRITLNTNGNFKYTDDFINSGLSTLIVAVDGANQESYAKHRNNGSIEKTFKLMKRFSEEKIRTGSKTELFWQYILFGHNDSDEEIIEAQRKGLELGVDLMDFDITRWVTKMRPSRFHDINEVFKFPIRKNNGLSIRSSNPVLFRHDNVIDQMNDIHPENINGADIKNCVVFGIAPKKIVLQALKSIGKFLPGTEIDLFSAYDFSADEIEGLKINPIKFPRGEFLSEKTVELNKLKQNYDIGLICTAEKEFFVATMNGWKIAKRLNCGEIFYYTGNNRLFGFKNNGRLPK